ncbi:MAG: hypothetical protein KAT32_02015 [Candidatus Moranbacteria bacterium]|nr:hypothetical protein [Candidatus Moranbacteria bacterium]
MNKEISKIIFETLIQEGVFFISQIDEKSTFSKETIRKTINELIDNAILERLNSRGSNVRYRLRIDARAVFLIFDYKENFYIEDFARVWGVSINTAKKYIKKFVYDFVEKIGKPPQKIIYVKAKSEIISFSDPEAIEKNYAYTTPDGQLLRGTQGFIFWAKNRSGRKDIEKLAEEYVELREKYYGKNNKVLLIDSTDKLKNVFGEDVYLEKLFHKDFDALPIFGKTYLSQLVRIAKSGRTNKELMLNIVNKIQNSASEIIDKYNIDCIGFIPPTVARKTQLMKFISEYLKYSCKELRISKIKSLVAVQQKSLRKIEDRILNAKKTIEVKSNFKCKNVLLIDDVTGSGATLNETAKKIIDQGIGKKVYGFTITGSAKAGVFDIISEA